MYYYIANPIKNKQEQNFFSSLRQKLTSEGIAGEMEFCSPEADAAKLAASALSKGFTTIVAIGDDFLASRVAGVLVDQPIALGIIPIGASAHLIDLLGYGNWIEAIQVLRHRKLGLYDIGLINEDIFFLTGLEIKADKPIDFNLHVSQFSANFSGRHLLIRLFNNNPPFNISNVLHFLVPKEIHRGLFGRKSQNSSIETLLRAEQAVIQTSPQMEIKMSDSVLASTPISLSLIPQSIRLITGNQGQGQVG